MFVRLLKRVDVWIALAALVAIGWGVAEMREGMVGNPLAFANRDLVKTGAWVGHWAKHLHDQGVGFGTHLDHDEMVTLNSETDDFALRLQGNIGKVVEWLANVESIGQEG